VTIGITLNHNFKELAKNYGFTFAPWSADRFITGVRAVRAGRYVVSEIAFPEIPYSKP
jgi:hypothetical protein